LPASSFDYLELSTMKKCPTCQKTFDDSMRFCQTDGTPLVDASEPVDPYKTMVARPGEIADAIPQGEFQSPQQEEKRAEPHGRDEDVLQLPKQNDPRKTIAVSEDEIRSAMSASQREEQVIEIPPLVETPAPEPPKFIAPEPSHQPAPPPSPFSAPEIKPEPVPSWPAAEPTPISADQPARDVTTPPIPSPFAEPKRDEEPKPEPPPVFNQPEPAFEPMTNPFQRQSERPTFDTPPTADTGWQKEMEMSSAGGSGMAASGGSGMSAPPAAAGTGQNKTLPIVSLILGILSLCCWISPLTGIGALITGYLGLKNASSNPSEYGGKPLAITGMILGGLFFLIGIAYWIVGIFFGGLSMLMNNLPR
jgi:hypothetical protein